MLRQLSNQESSRAHKCDLMILPICCASHTIDHLPVIDIQDELCITFGFERLGARICWEATDTTGAFVVSVRYLRCSGVGWLDCCLPTFMVLSLMKKMYLVAF